MPSRFLTKRIYEEPTSEDGYRVLVDRLWPRGVSKLKARIDLWAKDFTPSNDLRVWFHEIPGREEELATRYRDELEERRSTIETILKSIQHPTITLVTATSDLDHGHAGVLKRYLESLRP